MTPRVYLIATPNDGSLSGGHRIAAKGEMGAEPWVPEAELTSAEAVDRVARAICREQCAFYGEPPCWRVSDAWPQPDCDEPGCHALAAAALAVLPPPPGGEKGGE